MNAATAGGRITLERNAIEAALTGIAAEIAGDDVVSGAVRYALQGSGKRLRPILCVAAYEAAGGRKPPAPALYRAAAAIELIHTYSLIHDDLPCMDDDDLRRGRATTHRVFGSTAAMAAGFALIPLACGVLTRAAAELGVSTEGRAEAVRALCRGAGAAGMTGGQVLDLEAEGCNLTLAQLQQIHSLKTGALFQASLRIGAVLAGANPRVCDALSEFGLRLGLAFQIADDVLDVTKDASGLGKTPGKDIDAAKATFVSLMGVHTARTAARYEADAAIAILREAGLDSALLTGLAEFAVERDR